MDYYSSNTGSFLKTDTSAHNIWWGWGRCFIWWRNGRHIMSNNAVTTGAMGMWVRSASTVAPRQARRYYSAGARGGRGGARPRQERLRPRRRLDVPESRAASRD